MESNIAASEAPAIALAVAIDDEFAELIDAAVSPKRLAGLASTLRDVRPHVADRRGATL